MPSPLKITDRLVPALTVLIVVMAFVMGAMWNKLQTLESGGTTAANQPAAAQPGAANDQFAPEPVTQITDEQFQRIATEGNPATLGENNAKVTLVEFSDLQCPFCKRFADDTFPQIKSEYVDTGKVKVVYRHYPLRAIHPDAANAGMAAECAKDQGKFWEYHDLVYVNQTALSKDSLKKYAADLNLNTNTFNNCLDTEKHKAVVDGDESMGNSVGVSGTPAFFINGKLISGAMPFESFKVEIDAAL